jgi:hypothetical protein
MNLSVRAVAACTIAVLLWQPASARAQAEHF